MEDTTNSKKEKDTKQSVSIGGASAVTRGLLGQFLALWFRVPIKLFRPTRVDYMIIPRAMQSQNAARQGQSWSWKSSGPMVLASAVRERGWSFLPNYVLPPLLANSIIGVVLYTTYIESLQLLYPPSSSSSSTLAVAGGSSIDNGGDDDDDDGKDFHRASPRSMPPPPFEVTYKAGAIAGLAQAFVSQPIDALVVRFQVNQMLEGKYQTMLHYCFETLHKTGLKPIFGGFMLSATKESLAMGAFFGSFEFVKNQVYYGFLRLVYGRQHLSLYAPQRPFESTESPLTPLRKPHWLIGPTFLLAAGLTASLAHTSMHYPLSKVQEIHLARLESADYRARYEAKFRRRSAVGIYFSEYWKTARQCSFVAAKHGGWRRWLFKGIASTALRGAPATSIGLVIFESFRSHFAGSSVGSDVFLE